jgi:hypothetical protein
MASPGNLAQAIVRDLVTEVTAGNPARNVGELEMETLDGLFGSSAQTATLACFERAGCPQIMSESAIAAELGVTWTTLSRRAGSRRAR